MKERKCYVCEKNKPRNQYGKKAWKRHLACSECYFQALGIALRIGNNMSLLNQVCDMSENVRKLVMTIIQREQDRRCKR